MAEAVLPPHLRWCREAIDLRDQWWFAHDAAFCEAVLEARLTARYTLREIGDAVGLTATGVSHVISRGLALREAAREKLTA